MTSISKKEIIELLSLEGDEQQQLFRRAVDIRDKTVSKNIYFRGLIEFSNICVNDCLYCGIRRSNEKINRFELSMGEVMECVDIMEHSRLSSMVLQSGERRDSSFVDFICSIIDNIKNGYPDMCITLSIGEHKREDYQRMFDAGVSRYLLRIETSNKKHYGMLHPEEMDFDNRLRCLRDLREIGYQVGSGVMINSPLQTIGDLAGDILFLQELDIDMCGMGPYIPCAGSPLDNGSYSPEESLNLGLNMIAVLRIVMPDINIAATTALETLSPNGRELGLNAGANVIMPQFSPQEFREDYMLYNNKPLGSRDYTDFMGQLISMSRACGMNPELRNPGHSIHYKKRMHYGSTC